MSSLTVKQWLQTRAPRSSHTFLAAPIAEDSGDEDLPDAPVLRLLDKYSQPSAVLTSSGLHHVRNLAKVSKAFLKADWIKLIEQLLHVPMHIQYFSDGTPSLLKQRYALQSSGPLVVRGVASSSQELFEQRAFLTTSDGQHRAMLSEPRGLANGKSAWHLFQCYRDFVGTPRAGAPRTQCGLALLGQSHLCTHAQSHPCPPRLLSRLVSSSRR